MSHLRRADVTVNDVYDFPYDIAQECEKIVLLYGIDNVKPLVDKVINVLEILEQSIKRNEQLEAELGDLRSNNLHLSSEKIVSDHEKCKLKQIFEENEESSLQEVVKLKTQLSALKSENELLRKHLAVKKESCSKSDDGLKSVIETQENTIHRLRCVLKQKEKQLQDYVSNINAFAFEGLTSEGEDEIIVDHCREMLWTADFLPLSRDVDFVVVSPQFDCGSGIWCLRLYPNGKSGQEKKERTGLALKRLKSENHADRVEYRIGFRKSNGDIYQESKGTMIFDEQNDEYLSFDFDGRSVVEKEVVTSEGKVSIFCSMYVREKPWPESSRLI